MKARLLLLFALVCYTCLCAQNPTYITIKAGSRVRDVLTPAEIFFYPEFIKGKVFFRDGTASVAKLNYSQLVDEMHFIDPNGDTLAVANEKLIKYISIDKDTFYYDQGYVRLLADHNGLKLATKQIWMIGDTKKIGAYNTTNTTSSITSYSTYVGRGGNYNLVLNEDIDLRKIEYYFFGDKYNRFVPAIKKNALLLFAKEQRLIETYLKENKIDFTDKNDLEKLVQFLAHF